MKRLDAKFRHKGMPYTLLKRNDVVALYGIGETNTKEISHYEVDVIYIRKDKYGIRESIAKNDDFGRDRSRCYNSKVQAEDYFDELTAAQDEANSIARGSKIYRRGTGKCRSNARVSTGLVTLPLRQIMRFYLEWYKLGNWEGELQ